MCPVCGVPVDISFSPLVYVSLCLCVCVCSRPAVHVCHHVHACGPLVVNGLCYQNIKPPSPEHALPGNDSPRKAFTRLTWGRCVCCVSCPSPLGSSKSRTAAPDGSNTAKRLSVLQAVAQGYAPMAQEDTEQGVCTGNHADTKSLVVVAGVIV